MGILINNPVGGYWDIGIAFLSFILSIWGLTFLRRGKEQKSKLAFIASILLSLPITLVVLLAGLLVFKTWRFR